MSTPPFLTKTRPSTIYLKLQKEFMNTNLIDVGEDNFDELEARLDGRLVPSKINGGRNFRPPFLPAPMFTGSQKQALHKLLRTWNYKQLGSSLADISLRTHALMIGETGCGKTEVVRRFCKGHSLKFLSIACNSWIPHGAAAQPPTLQVVLQFIRNHSEGIIFLDEIDKAIPHAGGYSSSWTGGVFGEILAVLDGDERLQTSGWTTNDAIKLKEHFLCLGAGAFQFLADQLRTVKPRLGFSSGENEPAAHYAKRLAQASEFIPREVLSRFSLDWILLDYPSSGDYEIGMDRIRSELELSTLSIEETKKLTQEAIESRSGMRWLEVYLTRCLDDMMDAGMRLPNFEPKTYQPQKLGQTPLSSVKKAEQLEKFMARFEPIYERLLDVIFKIESAENEIQNSAKPEFCESIFGADVLDASLIVQLEVLRKGLLQYPFACPERRSAIEKLELQNLVPVVGELARLLIVFENELTTFRLYDPIQKLHFQLEIFQQHREYLKSPYFGLES